MNNISCSYVGALSSKGGVLPALDHVYVQSLAGIWPKFKGKKETDLNKGKDGKLLS